MRPALRILCVALAAYVVILVALFFTGAGGVRRHHIEGPAFILAGVAGALMAFQYRRARRLPPPRAVTIPAVVLAALGAITLWRAAGIGYLSDDFVLESWAASGRFLGLGTSFARPFVLGAWRVVYELGGGPVSLHLINVGLHAVNGVLTALIAQRLGLSMPGALLAAAVVMFWPTQVEPVLWTAGMFDVCMTAFVLACIYVNPLSRLPLAVTLSLAAAFAAAALFSKETAIVLPLLWFLCHGADAGDDRTARRRLLLTGGSLVLLCLAYLGWRYLEHLPLSGGVDLSRYVVKEHVSRLFASLILPFRTTTLDAAPWLGVCGAMLGAASLLAIVMPRLTGYERIAVQGIGWAVVAAIPTIGYLIIGADLDGSRYLYLPAVGWGWFLGAAWERSLREKWAVPLTVLLILFTSLAIRERQILVGQWIASSQARDRILENAVLVSREHQCSEIQAAGLPERQQGAQLFNNGFAEAFARRPDRTAGARPCTLTWVNGRFVVDSR